MTSVQIITAGDPVSRAFAAAALYWKLGLPLLALFGLVAIVLVPVFWPL
jgi:hypothetical protein